MNFFYKYLLIAIFAFAPFGAHAQTYVRCESERIASYEPNKNNWSEKLRWSDEIVPGLEDKYLYRVWLGYNSYERYAGKCELVVDAMRPVFIDGVKTSVPLRISSFVSENHWHTPNTLSSIDGNVLEIMVNSDPEKTALGFNLVGFENRKGIGGGYISAEGVRDSQHIDFEVSTLVKFTSTGSVKRAAILNKGSGVFTFSGDIDARDLSVPDFTRTPTGVYLYSDLISSGMVFEVVDAFNKFITGGDIVLNSKILADGMTAEFRKTITQTGKLLPIGSVTLPEPQIIVGGAASNTFKSAIVSTDTTFAKTSNALVLLDASPALTIENGATLTYGHSNQVPSNTSLTFRNPISKPVFNSIGASTGDTCDNVAGTLALAANSQSFGGAELISHGVCADDCDCRFRRK